MLFNLEPGGVSYSDKYRLATVKVNDEEGRNLPAEIYYIDDSQHFYIHHFRNLSYYRVSSSFQDLRLKAEKVKGDYKLALIGESNESYYYTNSNITTMPEYCRSKEYDTQCTLLEKSRVLIDPKDIISSENIIAILKKLERYNSLLEIRIGKKAASDAGYNVNIYNPFTDKMIGVMNNIVPYFYELDHQRYTLTLYTLYHMNEWEKENSYFTAKKLGNNYVGCISYENSTCKNFYNLNPDSFGYEHDSSPGPYPYYYNLENLGNFLEVDLNTKEYMDTEEKIKYLERQILSLQDDIRNLKYHQFSGQKGNAGIPGPIGHPGLTGIRGERGHTGLHGYSGRDGAPGEKGDRGPKGDKGKPGILGQKGEIGAPGMPGLDGKPAAPGDKGDIGPKGEDGLQGIKGEKGDDSSAIEIATELVTSKKAELGEAVLNAKDIRDENLATQVAGKISFNTKEFVNKIDVAKLTEGVVSKLSLEEAKNIIKDTVSKITSDATKKNNPDPMAFKKYEKFAEKLAELVVDRSSMSEKDANTLIKDRVSDWGLAKYLLLNSGLNKQTEALDTVKQEINKEKLIEHLLGYAELKGNVGATKSIVENIVHQFFDTKKVNELGRVVLEAKDDQGKKVLVNDPVLRKGIAEELRKNPGQMKGDTGAPGFKGNKGNIGSQGIKGEPGIDGTKGTKGNIGPKGLGGVPGSMGIKGDIGKKGDTGASGIDGLPGAKGSKGDKGDIGSIGLQGPKGHTGRSGPKGDIGPQGFKGADGLPGMPGPKGIDASPEEVAQKLINNGTIANQILEYREEGDLVLEQQIAGRLIYDKNIHEGIATELIENRAKELAEALLNSTNDTLVEKFANSTELIQSISEELRKNPGKIQGPKGDIGLQGVPGIKGSQGIQGLKGDIGDKGDIGMPGSKGDMGDQGLQGQKGERGFNGTQGEKGAIGAPGPVGLKGDMGDKGNAGVPGSKGDQGLVGSKGLKGDKGEQGPQGFNGTQGEPGINGLLGMPGPKGEKGDIGLQGPKGHFGKSGLKGNKGDTGSAGKDGVGAAEANRFLHEIKKAKNETLDAKKAAESAKVASEQSIKKAQDAGGKIAELYTKVVNLTEEAKAFKEEADDFANRAAKSKKDVEKLYSKVEDIFCKTNPTDQICPAPRGKRGIEKLNNLSAVSGASRPTSFISQVINFFYPSIKQDEYKAKNKIQELNQTAKIIDAVDIVTKFEKVLEETALKCGIAKKSFNFDPVELQSTIVNKSLLNDDNDRELLKLLCATAKQSFPNHQQNDRVLAIFKVGMEKILTDNRQQQIFVNAKEAAIDNKQPSSFISDVTSLNPNYGLASKERHRNRGLFRLHGIGNQNRKNMN